MRHGRCLVIEVCIGGDEIRPVYDDLYVFLTTSSLDVAGLAQTYDLFQFKCVCLHFVTLVAQ